MKKIFLFLFLLFPLNVFASSLEDIEILNGSISQTFTSDNNYYSVDLDRGENKLKYNYKLKDENSNIKEVCEGNLTKLVISTPSEGIEEYYFYLNIKEDKEVFHEVNQKPKKEIPNLKYYIGLAVLIIIIILFKVLVLN